MKWLDNDERPNIFYETTIGILTQRSWPLLMVLSWLYHEIKTTSECKKRPYEQKQLCILVHITIIIYNTILLSWLFQETKTTS